MHGVPATLLVSAHALSPLRQWRPRVARHRRTWPRVHLHGRPSVARAVLRRAGAVRGGDDRADRGPAPDGQHRRLQRRLGAHRDAGQRPLRRPGGRRPRAALPPRDGGHVVTSTGVVIAGVGEAEVNWKTDLSAVDVMAVTARQWAALNPGALKPEPITVEEVIASPLVSDPLRRLDCCLVSNGGGAIVVTTADRARRLPKKPVRVLGTGESHTHRHIAAMRDFTTTAATASSAAAWEMAGLGPCDMDVVQVYDAFTINTIVGLEDLGFCAKGDGGRLIEAGTGPGSKLPVNTSGGGLAYCHPGMFGIFLLVETVRQLRGECGARQVEAARHGVAHAFGGVFSGHATVVLGSDA